MTEILDSTRHATLAQRLRQRYRDLWADVQREVKLSRPYAELSSEAPDPGDAATADLLVDLNLAEVDRDLGEMRDIQGALERMTSGSYGNCPDCGGTIPYERLLANPAALRCQPCQVRYEKHHAQAIGPTL